MNKLLEYIIEQRQGHYCHLIQVGSTYEIECIIESLIDELKDQFTKADFIEFFSTMEMYAHIDPEDNDGLELTREQEDEIYNFSLVDCVNDIYGDE